METCCGRMRWLPMTMLACTLLITCAAFDVGYTGAMRTANNPQAGRDHSISDSLPCVVNGQRRFVLLNSNKKDDDANEGNLFRRKRFYPAEPIGMASSNSPVASNNSRPSSSFHESQYKQYYRQRDDKTSTQRSFITPEMEQQVMSSARANLDDKTVSRAISSLVDSDAGTENRNNGNKERNTLRYLAGNIRAGSPNQIINQNNINDNSWDTQQIAIASGATTFLLSPIIIPIINSFIPPILPFPSSISFEGAAFLGALAYILALGDLADQSNFIVKTTSGGMLGDGVEVTGAVSRIVGRTALRSVQTSAPRLKAVARAVVDYDNTVNTMEEMKEIQYQISRRLFELESENQSLRREVALFNAVEEMSSVYKLEELKEMARINGVRGYSNDGKTALFRRLVKEGLLDLDLTPYYQNLDD